MESNNGSKPAETALSVNQLEIGKRYWLDSCKDVSGVYIGNSLFNSIEGDNCYLEDNEGRVPLSGKFFLIN